jgi:DNA polymerase III alpha subunit
MLFLYCEGFDYDFEVTIFDRDYDEYKDKLDVGKIIIVEGNLDINFEYRRKNIRPRNIVTASLTQVREQARDMGLLDDVKRKVLTATDTTDEEEVQSETNIEQALDEKITENKIEKPQKNPEPKITKYIVEIPNGTKIEQIHKLKEFLSGQTPGIIATYILL